MMSIRWALRVPSRTLLFVQLFAVLMYPWFDGSEIGKLILSALSVGVLSTAMWMVRRSSIEIRAVLLFSMLGVICYGAYLATDARLLGYFGAAAYALAFFAAALSLIDYMMGDERATRDELWAAGATFMLFVEAYAWLCVLCQMLQPYAFVAPSAEPYSARTWVELLFLSGTNFSATGLSDILPLTPHARILLLIEQWNGVMYMALIVSRLAGMLGRSRKTVETP
jgi:NADH:ubiquinone oxidoreductase subunit 6 (subunit J)